MNIPFLKSRKDLFTLGTILILVIAVVAVNSAAQDQVNKNEIYYKNLLYTTVLTLKANFTSQLNNMNTTINGKLAQIETLQLNLNNSKANITSFRNQLNNSQANTTNYFFNIANYHHFTHQSGMAYYKYINAESNDTIGVYLFNLANASFTINKNDTNASITCTHSKSNFVSAESYYNDSKSLFTEILSFSVGSDLKNFANLSISLTSTDISMMQNMIKANNYMMNSISYYNAGNITAGDNQKTLMNSAVTTYNSLKVTRDYYISQIQAKLLGM